MTTSTTSWGTLTRLALRRDRIRLPIWLLGITGLVWATTSGIAELYTTEAGRAANAAVRAGSVVTRAFVGPATGSGLGALAMSEVLVFACLFAALQSIFTVVRHTRQNEELGRAELAGSAVVGRHAALTAALALVGLVNLAVFALCTLALLANDLPLAGSLAAGAAVGACGAVFGAVAALGAQLAESARGATGLAAIALAAAYLLRAAGDALGEVTASGLTVDPAWPSWLSPIGWAQQLRPFGANDWWPLALPAAAAVMTIGAAAWLGAHRDVGTGMMPVRRGRERAAPSLRTPLALALRLQRGLMLGWVIGVAVFAAVFGGIGNKITELFSSERSAEVIRSLGGVDNLVDAYFATILSLFGIVVAGYTVQALLRLRADESGGPAEAMLATAVGRRGWLLANVVCAVVGTVLLLTTLGLSSGLAYGLVTGDVAGTLADLVAAALAQLVPTLVLAGFVIAVFGLLPRAATGLSWAALAGCLVIGQFGSLLGLPQAVLNASPFTHLPSLPAETLSATPLLIMITVAAALIAAGTAALRRRDLVM